MSNFLTRYAARSSFMAARANVYKSLARPMLEVSASKIEKIADTFTRWADRDRNAGDLIWIAHASIAKRLKSGQSLSKALAGYIPKDEQLVIAAGEDTPRLGEVLESLVAQTDLIKEVRSALGGALFEPAMLFLGFLAASGVNGYMIWPAMEAAFAPSSWPAWTTPLRRFQVWYANWWILATGLSVALVVFIFATRPYWQGRVRSLFDRFPPWSSYRDLCAIQTLVMLGALTRAGKKLSESLEIVGKTSPPYLRWHLRLMRKRLNQTNSNIEQVFSTGVFQRELVNLIADASQGREVDQVFDYVARSMMKDIVRGLALKAKILNGVLMALVGSLFIYYSAVMFIGVNEASEKTIAAKSQGRGGLP